MPGSDITSSTSSACSSDGSNSSTITFNSSACSATSSERHLHQHPLPSSLKLHPDAAESKLSSPLNLTHYIESKLLSSPSPGRPRNVKLPSADSNTNYAVTKSMGLMKLRRQGSQPPVGNDTLLHQAAAARELMASLERLSLSEKVGMATLKNGTENVEREARRSLLGGEAEEEIRVEVLKGGAQGLPLCAKIAAAMDAEGRIGVQKEVAERVEGMMKERELRISAAANETKVAKKRKQKVNKQKKRRAAGSGRWIMRSKFRSTRTLLGKLWRNIMRLFPSLPKRNQANKKLLTTFES